jgi:hypothetical protein
MSGFGADQRAAATAAVVVVLRCPGEPGKAKPIYQSLRVREFLDAANSIASSAASGTSKD